MNYLKIMVFLLLAFFMTHTKAGSHSTIAVGGFSLAEADGKSHDHPFILVSHDGLNWTFMYDFSAVPSGLKSLFSTSVHCTDSFCIAGGGGIDDSMPYLITSLDRGYSWAFTRSIKGLSPTGFDFNVRTTHCLQNNCMAAGSYHEYGTCNIPFFLSSQDKGQTWVTARILNLPNIKNDCVEPQSIECTPHGCMAVGAYTRSYEILSNDPLLLTTDNGGKSWTFVKSKQIRDIPKDLKNGYSSSVACQYDSCVVVGSYKKKDHGNTLYPMILITKNAGKSWAFIKNLTTYIPGEIGTQLQKVKCIENTCVAIGYTTNKEEDRSLVLLVSHDNGTTWDSVKNILPENKKLGLFFSISCTQNSCVIASEFKSELPDAEPYDTEPFFLTSKDKGQSWVFIKNISGFPKGLDRKISLYQVHCTNESCYAVGASGGDYLYSPLILKSEDAGLSWKYSANIAPVPAKFINGVLYDMTD